MGKYLCVKDLGHDLGHDRVIALQDVNPSFVNQEDGFDGAGEIALGSFKRPSFRA